MRISDADRDRAASVLSHALAEGRLTPQEHSERLDAIFAAKTQADITPLISDLPNAAAPSHGGGTLVQPGAGPVATSGKRTRLVALFGAIAKKGAWHVPQDMAAVTVFSGGELDFREAVLPVGEIRLRATCILAGLEIIVPPEMHVTDDSWAIMGGIEIPADSAESKSPNAPVLHLSGVTIMGGVSVRRKARDTSPPEDRGQLTVGG